MIPKLHYISQGNTPKEHLDNIQKACTSGIELVQLSLDITSQKKLLNCAWQARDITAHFQTRLIITDHCKIAKAVKADVFITGDFKYHEFFEHENSLVIADIGHYESEQFTIDLLGHFLKEKFPKFAVHLTEINTNPVNYY